MTVPENMSFHLRLKKFPRDVIAERVQKAAKLLNIEQLLNRKPSQISGGQQQRAALGRAIVRQPTVYLMDEPLSNLDAEMRVIMRAELKLLQRDLNVTTVFVTHDQEEAMSISDRIAVMSVGELQQYAEPDEIYNRPANLFVAGFIGSPKMNMFEGAIRMEGDTYLLESESQEL
jgi:multiple sugar transport system ATP-binding protein